MKTKNGQVDYVLGIDLGVVSLGWAAIEIDNDGGQSLLGAGVRCWELSNASLEEVEKGKEEPPGQSRRQARQLRRQMFRRAQRLRRTYRVLQEMGLFLTGPRSSTARKAYLETLDQKAQEWLRTNVPGANNDGLLAHTFIYRLRAAALDHPLPPELLGRVFFHLAQRRGFLSNRRTLEKNKDEELGVVKQGISQLQDEIQKSGARTLGEFFSRLNPHEQRIRNRYTSRKMFQDEFEQIWNAQRSHHPNSLTDSKKARLYKAIFFQRPLKLQHGLVGRCPLEVLPRKRPNGQVEYIYPFRRAPMASLEAQRIRYMQRINDLEFTDPQGQRRVLSPEERQKLYDLAERNEDLSFTLIKKTLGIPTGKKGEGWECNLERGGEKKLPGNRTSAQIRKVIGDATWEDLGRERQKALVDTLIAFLRADTLEEHLHRVWGFNREVASQLAGLPLEQGYHSFSRRAIRRLLPLLEQGERLNAAIQKVYGGTQRKINQHAELPPVRQVLPTVRNPLLIRALTELRKVVNAIIRKYGIPRCIRVEVARELKRSRKEREEISKRMREQQKRREEAAQRVLQELGRTAAPRDIEKYLLAEECNWICPYTGKQITTQALLGDHPEFDVEHIWPLHRSLDDSFMNKTLCYHQENRSVKAGRTPYEAYATDPVRWQEIITRVRNFRGPFARQKLDRFQAEEIPPDFALRQLSDTRWISKAAADYLGHLYGGRIDPTGQQRVFTVAGGLTGLFRRAWNLNAILGGSPEKNRYDHRHHAIDAIVVALTEPSMIQRFAHEASRLLKAWPRVAVRLDPPWSTFLSDVQRHVEGIVVSFRVSRRLSGALHDQTYYAPPTEQGKTKVRKPLREMSSHEVERIVDPTVRDLVKEKLKQLGTSDPKKAFATDANLPIIRGKNNTALPVKSARIWVSSSVIAVGDGPRQRYVVPGNNHHIEIYALLDGQGQEVRWKGKIVSLYEAYERKKRGEPVVCRDHGPNTRFKFSLAKSEYIEWINDDGQKQLLRVVGISDDNLELRLPHDARPITLIREQRERIRATYRQLFQRRARKVMVTPLGEVLPAND